MNETYGGEEYDVATQLIQTIDGGYALVGITTSFGSGNNDYWLLKIAENGTLDWNKLYGGDGYDSAYDLIQTSDNGYLIVGSSNSSFLEGNDYDFLLIKTNSKGDLDWYKTYDGLGDDQATSVIQTIDGGYAILGITKSSDKINHDFLLIKTNSYGNISWSKTIGDIGEEMAWSLIQTSDGGFALAGYTSSYGVERFDFWLVKTDENGSMEWNRTFGGKDDDGAHSVIQTSDGGFALAGYTSSYGSGHYDFWLVKTDENGSMEWNRTFGGKDDDGAHSVIQTSDGGFALAGYSEILLSYDFFLVKTNPYGYLEWNKNYSGGSDERALSLIQTQDGGFAMAGYTHWPTGYDIFMVKTNESSDIVKNLSPIAYAGNDEKINLGENVIFNGTGIDIDGDIIRYRWDFDGNGIFDWESNQSSEISYIYNKSGTYNALLEVMDTNGSTALDMKKITVETTGEVKDEYLSKIVLLGFFTFLTILGSVALIILINKKDLRKMIPNSRFKHLSFLLKIDKWTGYLLFSFLFLVIIKFIFSLMFSTPQIYNDELIYGVLAKDIFHGNFMFIGYLPFSGAHPPSGYSYFMAPAYLLGNNMDVAYHGMLFINCILSSLVIFPVFFIMKRFVDNKLSFLTSLLVAILPTIIAHNFLIMSENAFYLVFLFSCLLMIKTFTYEKLDRKFILYSLLLGLSVGLLVMIRSLGVAMLPALFFVFIYKIIKERKLVSLKYGIVFLPFLPVIGYMLFRSGSAVIGYPVDIYLNNLYIGFSNLSNFIRFFTIILNEINYFIVMSYIIFFAFMIFLFLNLKKIQKEKKEPLLIFILFSLTSILLLILLTTLHINTSDFNIYTRYVSPGLPVIFMLGVIGINLFQKISNKKHNVILHISLIFILLTLFFILFFVYPPYKNINNLDIIWIVYLNQVSIFNVDGFTLLRTLFVIIITLFSLLIILKLIKNGTNFKLKSFINRCSFRKNNSLIKKCNNINFIFIIAIILSLILFIPTGAKMLEVDENTMINGINRPARWFMLNDPDAKIILEDSFSAFSGGGMEKDGWDFMYADMHFWLPDAYVEIINRTDIIKLINTGEINSEYILSTHDLTQYYPVIKDIYMDISVNPMKKQDNVDWHIYKIE